jgi:hypothetical protein
MADQAVDGQLLRGWPAPQRDALPSTGSPQSAVELPQPILQLLTAHYPADGYYPTADGHYPAATDSIPPPMDSIPPLMATSIRRQWTLSRRRLWSFLTSRLLYRPASQVQRATLLK